MTYTEFKYRFSPFPIVLSNGFANGDARGQSPAQAVRNQLSRWQKRGLIVRLKNGMYLLNEHDRKINPSRVFLANQMCVPSYVSLEYALAYYGLIPERVVEVTSVTTKKTLEITNPTGRYSYRHLKPSAFTGFRLAGDENGMQVFLAEPEKAVVDFLYFTVARTVKTEHPSPAMFAESHRFQNVEMLSGNRILELAPLYDNAKLSALAKLFCRFRKEQART
ncbi:MAG: hypothetical protein WEB33_02005 [Bacteroidota bacterium]